MSTQERQPRLQLMSTRLQKEEICALCGRYWGSCAPWQTPSKIDTLVIFTEYKNRPITVMSITVVAY